MPLTPGAPVSESIRELHTGKTFRHTAAKFGKKRADAQAVAIAISNASKRRASGGVANFDDGGAVQQVVAALQQGAGSGVGSPGTSSTPTSTPGVSNPAAPSSPTATAATSPTPVAGMASVAPNAVNTAATTTAATPGVVQQNTNPSNPITQKLLNTGGVANLAVGGFDVAKKANLKPPPYQRQEIRSMHVGPILSHVPGMSDNHAVKVPSGAYILPASHIAALGKGNTNAGMAVAARMFGMGHRLMQSGMSGSRSSLATGGTYSEGGARGDPRFPATNVNLSGGEFAIDPASIIRKFGSLKKGHAALDAWVMATRAAELKRLKKLPAPAKK